MSDQPTIHEIEIAIDGVPTYVLDVPSTLGRGAAERRAYWAIASQNPQMDLDRISVCDPS